LRRLVLALALAALGACASTTEQQVEHLATGSIASDFDTYELRRVGILPPIGRGFDVRQSTALQGILFTEFSQQAPYEFVPMHEWDLEEIDHEESYVRGRFEPAMVIELARRFQFDAMLVCTVVDARTHDPQRLSLAVDLVASETGAAIWSASVQLDASNDRTRRSLRAFYDRSEAMSTEHGAGWELALDSPSLFAQFACWQLACLL
jgi:hypothetical protein